MTAEAGRLLRAAGPYTVESLANGHYVTPRAPLGGPAARLVRLRLAQAVAEALHSAMRETASAPARRATARRSP